MRKRALGFFMAIITAVTAGVYTPAVSASVAISDSNVTVFTNKLEKSGTGTVSGIAGTEKTVGESEFFSDYSVNMTGATGYAYIKDTSIQQIKADDYGLAYFKFSISGVTDFVMKLDLNYGSTGGSNKTVTVLNAKNHTQITGTQKNPKDYTAHVIFDLGEKKVYVFFNNIIKDEAIEVSVSDLSFFRQLRFANNAGVAHAYTVSDMLLEAFPKDATYNDVLGYLMGTTSDIDYVNGTYFEGINDISESNTVYHGSMYCTDKDGVTGNNTEGYTFSDQESGSFYRYFLYNNASGNGTGMEAQADESVVRHSVALRPNSGDKYLGLGKYDASAELMLLKFDKDSGTVSDREGVCVLENYDENTFYQIDLFFNNKDYEYSLYFEGKEIDSGNIPGDFLPMGYVFYKNGNAGDSMTVKNIFTKIYALGTSMSTVIGDLYGTAYIEIRDFTVSKDENGAYEISAAAVFCNISKNYGNASILYALYKDGELMSASGQDITDAVAVTDEEIGLSYGEIDRKYPYGLLKTDSGDLVSGDTVTVKAWLFADNNASVHLVDSNEVTFTAE